MSEAGRVHHNRVGTGCCRGTAEGGSTVVAESAAVAVMTIRIATIKLVACPADRRRLNQEACCRRVAVEEDSTAVAGNTAVAVMAIRITTIMVEARRADHRRLNREACCRRVAVEEDSTAVEEDSTAVAGMAIHITTIKLAARRADRRQACMLKEEGIITEGGSTGKGEG